MMKISSSFRYSWDTTALGAVLADARQLEWDEYWLLGDILMPGTGVEGFWTCWPTTDYG